MDTRFEGNGEDVVVVLAIVIDQKRFSDLKLLLIINVFIFNQVMHIVNEIPIDIYFDFIYLAISYLEINLFFPTQKSEEKVRQLRPTCFG